MKIAWGLRRKHVDVLANIDRLEHELGLATEQLLPERKGFPALRGPVDLSHIRKPPPSPVLLISSNMLTNPEALAIAPGAVIPVHEGGRVEFLPTMSSAVSSQVSIVPRSRVELPPGVRLH